MAPPQYQYAAPPSPAVHCCSTLRGAGADGECHNTQDTHESSCTHACFTLSEHDQLPGSPPRRALTLLWRVRVPVPPIAHPDGGQSPAAGLEFRGRLCALCGSAAPWNGRARRPSSGLPAINCCAAVTGSNMETQLHVESASSVRSIPRACAGVSRWIAEERQGRGTNKNKAPSAFLIH